MVARKPIDQVDELEKKYKNLTADMIDKASVLLNAAGDGSGELKIKQIEKAIEIYKAINAEFIIFESTSLRSHISRRALNAKECILYVVYL